MEIITEIAPWYWFVLAVILLGAEALGAGGFLIGAAVAALIVWGYGSAGITTSWQYQLLVFATLTLILSIAYWKYFRPFNQQTDRPNINKRASQLIGRRMTLAQDISSGEGKVSFGDTLWRIRCNDSLRSGDAIEVTGCDGSTLIVEKRSASPV